MKNENETKKEVILEKPKMSATVMIPVQKIDYERFKNFGFIDFVVYASALWYLCTEILIGPFVRSFISKKLWLCEMGRQMFFYNPDDDEDLKTKNFEYKQNEKVKIHFAQNDDGGDSGVSNTVMQYPRIFIDDNGIVLKNHNGPPRHIASQIESERLLLNSQSQRSNYANSPIKNYEDIGSPARLSNRNSGPDGKNDLEFDGGSELQHDEIKLVQKIDYFQRYNFQSPI